MRRVLLVVAAASLVGGCATKKYVGQEVGEVNQKVDAVSAEVDREDRQQNQHHGRRKPQRKQLTPPPQSRELPLERLLRLLVVGEAFSFDVQQLRASVPLGICWFATGK